MLNKGFLNYLSDSIFTTYGKDGRYMVRVILQDGMVIEGTSEQVRETLEKIKKTPDPSQYYLSDTSGEYLPIKSMNSVHIRNATLKMQKAWLDTLYTITDPRQYARAVAEGLTDQTFVAMMK